MIYAEFDRLPQEETPRPDHEMQPVRISMLPVYAFSSSSSSASRANRFWLTRSCLLSRAALVFARLASISSLRTFSRCFSALALWIYSKVSPSSLDNQFFGCGENTYMFNEGTLVLEGVTLAQVVQVVVEVLVDLASGAVLSEKATEDTLAAHPQNLAIRRI